MFWYCIQTDQYRDFQKELHLPWQGHVFFEDWAHTFARQFYWKYMESILRIAVKGHGYLNNHVNQSFQSYGTVITLTLAIKLQKMEMALCHGT